MGDIVKISCPKCSLNKQLNLGQGMFDCNLDRIITYLPEQDALQVGMLQRENRIKSFEFNRYPGICTLCKQLEESPLLVVELHSGARLEYGITCRHCGSELRIIREELKPNSIPCPYCGKSKLTVSRMGYWD